MTENELRAMTPEGWTMVEETIHKAHWRTGKTRKYVAIILTDDDRIDMHFDGKRDSVFGLYKTLEDAFAVAKILGAQDA